MVQATPGEVLMFFSEAEFDFLLDSHAEQLIVLEAGLSWCRPCKGFEKTFQVSQLYTAVQKHQAWACL